MSPNARARALDHLADGIRQGRGKMHSLAQARQFLPACPQDTELLTAIQVEAQLVDRLVELRERIRGMPTSEARS